MRTNTTLLFLAFCSYVLLPVWAVPASQGQLLQSQSVFMSGKKQIRVEWFKPSGTATKRPAVLILYGSGGMEPSGGFYRELAADLSQSGLAVGIVHYFDREGIEYATSDQMGRFFGQWLEVLGDAITHAGKTADVDSRRIGLLGLSLGSQLAIARAAHDSRVSCLADFSGSLVTSMSGVKHMPPILILHGSADRVVPIQKERQLEEFLKRIGTTFEKHIFKGQGHIFEGESLVEAQRLAKGFLTRELLERSAR